LNRNSNEFSVEVPANKIYDKDSEVADPVTPTPDSPKILNDPSIRIDEEELQNSGIECQTDLQNALRLKLRRSRKSFQNQVYLEDSQATLRSNLHPSNEKSHFIQTTSPDLSQHAASVQVSSNHFKSFSNQQI
jgi:hypothetical protein